MHAAIDPVAENTPIQISFLGRFEVRAGASLLHLPTRKARGLLAYLALTPGKVHDREKVHGLLWPESGTVQAKASLRQALLALRKALSPHSPCAVRASGTTLVLDPSQVSVDVAMVERRIAEGTHGSLEAVPSVCTGPLLDGFAVGEVGFEQWVEFERARLHERIVGALEKLADFQVRAGQVDRAIDTALQSLRLEPLQERTHRSLMRLYTMHGRRAEAVHQYETFAAMLRRELAVEPEEQTRRLHHAILREAGSIDGDARGPAMALPRSAIDGPETEIGRPEQALDDARAGSGRLVVLSGEAEVGNTRFLDAVAASALERGEPSVGPLSREQTLALLRSLGLHASEMIDAAALDQIWAFSDGNGVVVAGPVGGPEPREIAGYVARLDRLGRDVLATAAAIGRHFLVGVGAIALTAAAGSQEARAAGIANTGIGGEEGTVVSTNPTALLYNPGAMGLSEGSQLGVYGQLAIHHATYTRPFSR